MLRGHIGRLMFKTFSRSAFAIEMFITISGFINLLAIHYLSSAVVIGEPEKVTVPTTTSYIGWSLLVMATKAITMAVLKPENVFYPRMNPRIVSACYKFFLGSVLMNISLVVYAMWVALSPFSVKLWPIDFGL